MATPKDMVTQGNRLIDDEVSTASWLDWYNDGIDDLLEAMSIEAQETLATPDSAGWFDLPENFKGEILIQTADQQTLYPVDLGSTGYIGYKIFDGKIQVTGMSLDTLSVFYYKIPAKLASDAIDVVVDIPDQYIEPIILYGCMRALQADDEGERYLQFRADYREAKSRVLRQSSKAKPARVGAWAVVR